MDTPTPALNIVLVEDHPTLRQLLVDTLRDEGHEVVGLGSAEELDERTLGLPVDVFLLDLNLPGEDGLSLATRLRAVYPLAGIIMVTARSELQDKLAGYARGADLYLTKPVEPAELCAAVAAMGQRRVRMERTVAASGTPSAHLVLHRASGMLRQPGREPIHLTVSEATLLAALALAPGRSLAYWQIAEILGLDLEIYAKSSLEVRLVRLRKKLLTLGAPSPGIEALRQEGYRLCTGVDIV